MNKPGITPVNQIFNAVATPEKVELKPTGKGKILNLIPETDPLLRSPSEPYVFEDKTFEDVEQFYWDMVDTMRYNRGVGLSAVQVGIPVRMFVIETGGDHPEALFNPRIIRADTEVVLEEGCLSFPDIWVKVKRPSKVRIRYQLLNGETVTKEFVGFTARVVLHEYDHMDGVTMKDRANKIHWDAAMKKRKTYKKRRVVRV